MSDNLPIVPQSNYVSPIAIGFADADGNYQQTSEEAPLPVFAMRPAAPPPLEGTASEPALAGPFTPLYDVPIHLELRGEWTGEVVLQRSVDGGATRAPVTVGGLPWARFAANANEVVWQEGERGATFYLGIAVDSGTLAYRVSQ